MKKYSFLLMCLCGCAMANPDELPPVIDNSSYPTAAPLTNPVAAPSSSAMYELMGRLDRLQAEVQQLTGKVEEQGHQISELKKSQTTMYSDFDERLQNAEKGGNTNPAAESATQSPVSDVLPAPSSSPSGAPDSSVAETTAPPVAIPVESGIKTPPRPPAPKPPEVQASGGEKQAYQQAYTALRSGKTDQSIEQFKSYQSQFPTGGYADMSYYWLGEAYRVKLDNDSARQAFNTVLEKYPSSTKVADALLKLGYIEADQKNVAKAREYLTRVTSEFANTPAARSAERKLAQLK
ncbi:MAG: tol-pal system protein YbgF [Methylococcales bacterium]|nr:tol-pal system protein YbgF [Methylococcales bacterium]MDP3839711.1 tol-pal system protein YbgF [Methylococcales bacterium]